MRSIHVAALVAVAVTLVGAADPKATVAARQDGMKQVGRNFKAINDQLHAGTPDAAVIRASAHALADLAPKVPSWFPRGSGVESGAKTGAKAEIWAQPADFASKAAALAGTTKLLAAAADGSADPAVLTPLVAQVGGTCKACHTTYKAPEH